MISTPLTAREFSRSIRKALATTKRRPVYITKRGRPAHVRLTYEAYRQIAGDRISLAEALAGPPEFDFDFDPPRLRSDIPNPPQFND